MSDTISRQAAIDELDKGAWGVEWDKTLAKAMIESLPSAQFTQNTRVNSNNALDTISRQAVFDMANGWTYNFCDPEDEWAAMKEIRELPSAEPEIVRCKECKWSYDGVGGRICAHGVCVDCVVGDDFYCADAERSSDG